MGTNQYLFFRQNKKIYVGKLMHSEAKITRYKYVEEDFEKIDDILDYYLYPAYLAENTNGDICVSDNNRCVIVVDQDRKLRFKYTGPEQSGFTPYGIWTNQDKFLFLIHVQYVSVNWIKMVYFSVQLCCPKT